MRHSEGLFATQADSIFVTDSKPKRDMKTVTILVPETAVLAAIVDPRYMFTAVNEFLKSAGQQPLFKVQLVGLNKEVKLNDGLFTVHTDAVLKNAGKSDLKIGRAHV